MLILQHKAVAATALTITPRLKAWLPTPPAPFFAQETQTSFKFAEALELGPCTIRTGNFDCNLFNLINLLRYGQKT